MHRARQRWQRLGMRRRMYTVFLAGGVLLAVSAGMVIWVLAHDYSLNLRTASAVRQASVSAMVVERLLVPGDALLRQEVQQLAEMNESGILVLRDGQVLASSGLTSREVPQQFQQRVDAGQALRQRVRIGGEVRLLVGLPLATGASYYQSLPFRNLNAVLDRLRIALLVTGVIVLLLSLLLARLAVRGALRPVQELTAAAHAVARGELNTRMPEDDRDLAAVASVFNATTADLERRVRADARFAGTVSHELRSPLTTMANAVALLEHRREELPEVAQEAVEMLDSQLTRFRQLLLGLLDIAVATNKPDSLVLEPVELTSRLQSLAAAEGWGPVIVCDPPVAVQADARRLDRVVSNLVRNAQTHGQGLVRVAVLQQDGSGIIEVDDAGPGVPTSERERIFERFTRGEPQHEAGHPPGIGLGLAFAAELVAVQHGQVSIRDRPGGGARFVVALPLATT